MTDSQIEALLYGRARVEMDGFVINSWLNDSTNEKNIELVWRNPQGGKFHSKWHDSLLSNSPNAPAWT